MENGLARGEAETSNDNGNPFTSRKVVKSPILCRAPMCFVMLMSKT